MLKEKSKRTTHCMRGHLRTEDTTYRRPGGLVIECRICRSIVFSRHHFGGNRETAIQRDHEKCVHCGMSREEHKEVFGFDITVDHIKGRGTHDPKSQVASNSLENLQTLCIRCHIKKDTVGAGKLTKEDVLDIRLFASKGMKAYKIWRGYQMVNPDAIVKVISHRSWKGPDVAVDLTQQEKTQP